MKKLDGFLELCLGGAMGMWFGGLMFFLPISFIAWVTGIDELPEVSSILSSPWFWAWCGAAGGYFVGKKGTKLERVSNFSK